jgi:geranylgeranyl pyrophosphate synthase
MARDFARRAVEALNVLPDLGDRQTLQDLTEYILDRRT